MELTKCTWRNMTTYECRSSKSPQLATRHLINSKRMPITSDRFSRLPHIFAPEISTSSKKKSASRPAAFPISFLDSLIIHFGYHAGTRARLNLTCALILPFTLSAVSPHFIIIESLARPRSNLIRVHCRDKSCLTSTFC